MNRIKMLLVALMVVALIGIVAAPHPVAANAAATPLRLTFDKSASGTGVWQGTVGGDLEGSLTTVLTDLQVSGSIWLVEFDWIVNTGDEQSFTAHLSGILNTSTGSVVMNGEVAEGWLLGAKVHEAGQLVNAATLHFQGTIDIVPMTADWVW